jgi:hypothetical protein
MKIFIILSLIIFSNLSSILSKRRFSHHAIPFDPALANDAVKILFSKIVDPSTDTLKLIPLCIDKILNDPNLERYKILAWKSIYDLAAANKNGFTGSLLSQLLSKGKILLVIEGKETDCSSYLKNVMLSEEKILQSKTQDLLKSGINQLIGSYPTKPGNKGDKLITHFINQRHKNFISKNLFHELNGNKTRRLRK